MKLRNKKTGDIGEVLTDSIAVNVLMNRNDITGYYTSLEELNAEWEDYEEPKGYWFIDCAAPYPVDFCEFNEDTESDKEIGNYFSSKEEAELAVRKLKAWKRLKDKGFEFCKYSALAYGEIEFRIPDFEGWNEEENEQIKADLDLLFGGEDE